MCKAIASRVRSAVALKTFDDFHKVKNLIVITSLIKRYVDLVTDKRQLIKSYSLDYSKMFLRKNNKMLIEDTRVLYVVKARNNSFCN